jgi:hypothetical protein
LSNVPKSIKIFNFRFINEIKNIKTNKIFEKSRLVVQVYNNLEKSIVLTQSPTIQCISQRLILVLAASFPQFRVYLRDIT